MNCVVCNKESSPYKCPNCRRPYCSVECWGIHKKAECEPTISESKEIEQQRKDAATIINPPNLPLESELDVDGKYDAVFERIWRNTSIQCLFQCKGVTQLLGLVVKISQSHELSGESTSEGRQMVALKKITELRKGGREANEAIEELVASFAVLIRESLADG